MPEPTPIPAPPGSPSPWSTPQTGPLPPPPPVVAVPPFPTHAPRPGALVPWSRLAHLLVWAGIALGLGLVVRSSITTGLGTWWIGPAGHQHHMLIIALPFALPILMLVLVLGWSPYVPWVGMLAALALGALALIDRDYVRGYAAIEAGLAAGGLLISVLSLFGRYQAAPEPGR